MKHLKCTSYSPYYRCSHIWTDRDPSRSPGYRFWNLIPLLENMWEEDLILQIPSVVPKEVP